MQSASLSNVGQREQVKLLIVHFKGTNDDLADLRLPLVEVGEPSRPIENGILTVPEARNCELGFLTQLEAFALVSANRRERQKITGDWKQIIYSVRFIWAPIALATISPEFEAISQSAKEVLSTLVQWYWTVNVWDNPYYHEGLVVPGQRAIVVNAWSRNPQLGKKQQPGQLYLSDYLE